jgi:hypothetical protein
MKRLAAPVAAILLATPAAAQDASLGCKILLCAAATAPSWQGIPYCVPPMTQLFSILRRGGAWPSCPEGSAGGLNYQPLKDCPAGQTAVSNQSVNIGEGSTVQQWTPDPNGGFCAKPEQINNTGPSCAYNAGTLTCTQNDPIAREVNDKPYYVDITPQNSPSFRFWFNLQ